MLVNILLVIAGLILLMWGADRFVHGAAAAARNLGVAPLLIGLTIVAFATSAPEILVAVVAAIENQPGLAIGNAIGSNVFNLLFVLGLVSLTTTDLPIADDLIRLNLPVMLAASLLCVPFAITHASITRWEGAAFLALYIAYTTYLVLDGLENGAANHLGIGALIVLTPPIVVATALEYRRHHYGATTASAAELDESHALE